MLTVNTMGRIDIYEIKRHPWFVTEKIDLYVEKLYATPIDPSCLRINNQIIEQVMKCNFNFHNFDMTQVKEAIALKKEYSFVICYELLVDEKRKKQNTSEDIQNYVFDTLHGLLEERSEEMKEIYMENIAKHSEENSWYYGYRVNTNLKFLMDCIYQTMIMLDITFKIKSPSYKLKCFYKIKRVKSHYDNEMKDENDD
jgi:5'-AMP-activated protein kinase catalytic alpha subunit